MHQHKIYANEIDVNACHWLSKLPLQLDTIDSRSIAEVHADDLQDYQQCHFFAGIGGWPLALHLAQWPIDAPVWTGSCPCQPFSAAGKRKGFDDERHLWPEFRRLIDECRPTTIFGEQVASKDGRDWLAVVRADLEALGYAVGAADLCAAGVGAPHIRQRLFWVAHRYGRGLQKHMQRDRESIQSKQQTSHRNNTSRCGENDRMADSNGDGRRPQRSCDGVHDGYVIAASGQWSDVYYVECQDGKSRPVKPGVRLLAHGIPGRVAQLRGLGNAIVPQVAAQFIAAFLDTLDS